MYWLLIGLGFPLLTLFTIGLYSVSPEWTIRHSKVFPLFYLLLHSSCFGGHGPPFTVISLDDFIIYFPSHSNTSPYLSWKHHCYWSPFTPDFITDFWLQGDFIEFTPTQIYFYIWILILSFSPFWHEMLYHDFTLTPCSFTVQTSH